MKIIKKVAISSLIFLVGCMAETKEVQIGDYSMSKETYNLFVREGIGDGKANYERMQLFGSYADKNGDRYLTKREVSETLGDIVANAK